MSGNRKSARGDYCSERAEDPVPFQSKAATTTETAANGHAAAAEGRRTDGRTEGGSGDDAATARDRITRFSSTMMLSGGGDVENTTDREER